MNAAKTALSSVIRAANICMHDVDRRHLADYNDKFLSADDGLYNGRRQAQIWWLSLSYVTGESQFIPCSMNKWLV